MRKLRSLVVCLTLILALSPGAFASTSHILDEADLLSPGEITLLNEAAQQIAENHDISVVILTTDSLDGASTWEHADNHFYNGDYGENGILLLISMEYRDWEIATYGDVAERISNSQCDALFDAMSDELSRDEFYEGFADYLEALGSALSKKSYRQNTGLQIAVSLLIGAVAALIAILIMRSKMNTVRPQHSAGSYLRQGSYGLTEQRDIYLYSNITKTRRSQNTSSGGGSRGGSRGKF